MNKLKSSILLVSASILFLAACTKSTTSATDTEGNWVKVSTLDGNARSFAVAFTIGNFGYVGTGLDGNNKLLSDFWKYDPTNNSWTQVASMPSGREAAVGMAIDGNGYVGTGTDSYGNYYNDFYQYNPTTDTWTKKANFPGAARSRATAFAIGDNGYITCGWDGNYYKDMYAYNATNDTWQQEISLSGDKRFGAMSFVYNNMGYVVGGTNSGGQASVDFWRYNPTTSNWTRLRDISNTTDSSFDDNYTNIARTNGVAFVIGNQAFVATGQSVDAGSFLTSTWSYDFATDLWEARTPYESTRSPRKGAVAFTVNGRAFIGTGISTTSPYDNFDEFIPSETYNAND